MLNPLVRRMFPALLAGLCAVPLAHADIYQWTDEKGRVNVSNLAPPEGVHVSRVVRETVPNVAPREDPARDALREAEVRVLAERVRQLQDEVELAKRPAPQMVEYRMVPAPPVIQYIQAPPAQYAMAPQPVYGGCDFDYFDCGLGWSSGFYPGTYVVVSPMPYRRGRPGRGDNPIGPRPPIHGGGHIAPWLPIVGPGAGRGH